MTTKLLGDEICEYHHYTIRNITINELQLQKIQQFEESLNVLILYNALTMIENYARYQCNLQGRNLIKFYTGDTLADQAISMRKICLPDMCVLKMGAYITSYTTDICDEFNKYNVRRGCICWDEFKNLDITKILRVASNCAIGQLLKQHTHDCKKIAKLETQLATHKDDNHKYKRAIDKIQELVNSASAEHIDCSEESSSDVLNKIGAIAKYAKTCNVIDGQIDFDAIEIPVAKKRKVVEQHVSSTSIANVPIKTEKK